MSEISSKPIEKNDGVINDESELFGAIYLGNVDTEFRLKNSQNQLTGEISKTGTFLSENGSAGTIQHVDFIV